MTFRSMIAPLALACGIASAQAQPIYRCGDSYGSQPCAGGKEIASDAPTPTALERRQAGAAAQRDARIADGLEKDRLKQEANPARSYIPPAPDAAKPEPHKWPEKNATRKLDVFTASAPGPKADKKGKAGKEKAAKAKPEGPAPKPDKAAAAKGAKAAKAAPSGRLGTSTPVSR